MILDANGDPEFMTSLARGLAVLSAFSDCRQRMTIAEASRLTGLSRPAARRCLHTLVRLGYAAHNGTTYSLRPKVLSLGYSFLSSNSLAASAQPALDALRDELHESCSLSVLEDDEACYVARAEAERIMSITLRVGSRLPLYCTSMGRVLLAHETQDRRDAYFRKGEFVARTPNTVTRPSALQAIVEGVREQGYALVDEELEMGLRSLAVPVWGRGAIIAALNVGASANRVSAAEMRTYYLPSLRKVARELGAMGLG